MNRPFLPSDIAKPDPLRNWRRGIAAKCLAFMPSSRRSWEDTARELWGDEEAAIITRGAVSPSSLTGWVAIWPALP